MMTSLPVRIGAALIGLTWVFSGVALAIAPVQAQAGPAANSEVTVSGTGEFANLKVTVSQTQNLINQVVRLSWTGAKPTSDVNMYLNYLQIMQCWGDDPTGPKREQCQSGSLYTDTRGGAWTGSRQVSYGGTLEDKAETYLPTPAKPGPPATPAKDAFVPFWSVDGGKVEAGGGGPYFDANKTNEIPYGRTRPDGTGEEFLEIQTALEAPGLGCGERLTDPAGNATGRSCWLVIVPRGETEVNGTTGDRRPHRWLDSSPLSMTNWKNHISIPLGFQPLGQSCPMGVAERLTAGHESLSEAVLRWQTALCANGGSVFGFSQVTDDQARNQLVSKDPGMAFLSRPVPPDQLPPGRQLVYAPMSVSGVTIAVNIERRAKSDANGNPTEAQKLDGQRFADLKLTPKLVAKLLTQSYRLGADFSNQNVANNPLTMVDDPEFIALNPEFATQLNMPLSDMLVPLGQTDVASTLWTWVYADPEARSFLEGKADPPTPDGKPGMQINPAYSQHVWPDSTFPKSDLYCVKMRGDGGQEKDWCTLDMHPYTTNMHEAARAASRGDTLVRRDTSRDSQGNAIGWKKGAPQLPGQRAVLAVADAAIAARYGLPTVKLRNAAGAFVAPTTESLLAGVAAMKPGAVAGVLEPDPSARPTDAYPLTTISYAATAPSALDAAAGQDYAKFLRYAANDGQVPGVEPGRLPFGYAPMPPSLRAQTTTAAQTIADQAGKPVAVPNASKSTPPPADVSAAAPADAAPTDMAPIAAAPATGAPAAAAPTAAAAAPPAGGSRPVASGAPAAAGKPSPTKTPTRAAVIGNTPAQPVGTVRYALVAILILGGLAAGGGPLLLRLAVDRTKGVMARTDL